MVTAKVSFLVTVTLLGAWGVVFSTTSMVRAVRVATSLWTWKQDRVSGVCFTMFVITLHYGHYIGKQSLYSTSLPPSVSLKLKLKPKLLGGKLTGPELS